MDLSLSRDLPFELANGGRASITFRATNLFDRRFVVCSAASFCNYGEGRRASLDVAYRW